MINLHFKDYEEFGMNPQHTSGKHRLQQHKQKLQQSPHQQQQEELERYNAEELYRTQYLAGRNTENHVPLRNSESLDETGRFSLFYFNHFFCFFYFF